MADGPADLRRAYREWVRTHHPDAGGDPGAFRDGLEQWRQRLDRVSTGIGRAARSRAAGAGSRPVVTVYRRRGVAAAVTRWWWRRRRAAHRRQAAGSSRRWHSR